MSSDRFRIDLLPVMTLVVWLTCLVVGLAGHFITVSSPAAISPQKPTQATLVNVSLTDSPALPGASSAETVPTPPAPELPQPTAISPAAEFATPAARTVVVSPKPVQSATVFRQITFGTGEGNQPKPDYPLEAQLDGQEGTVEVQFVVGQDGRVNSSQVTHPCAWPLLNQAAERSIRDSWTYPAGAIRYLKVSITYRQKH